jgi:hypothetical protein
LLCRLFHWWRNTASCCCAVSMHISGGSVITHHSILPDTEWNLIVHHWYNRIKRCYSSTQKSVCVHFTRASELDLYHVYSSTQLYSLVQPCTAVPRY